jgi:hypothetical protein
MPVQQLRYDQPRFWTPANALGKAATIDVQLNGKPVQVTFYWTDMALIDNSRTVQQLGEEAARFLQIYHPKHVNATDLHFVRNGADFKRVLDPGWIPGY